MHAIAAVLWDDNKLFFASLFGMKVTPLSVRRIWSRQELDRIIEMAWEDRTSFDAIRSQFGLTPGEVIAVMRSELKPSSFRLWRARTTGRKTKHIALRGFVVGRFRCPNQPRS